MALPAYANPLRVGESWQRTLCTPSPRTTSMDSARKFSTFTSSVWPVEVTRTVILSGIIGRCAPCSRRCLKPRTHEADVLAQRVQLVGVSERHVDAVDALLELVERSDELGTRALVLLELGLDQAQVAVPAEDARAHAEAVERRYEARQRDQDRDDREERHPHAVDEIGEPERQVALQERRPLPVVALRVAG